MAERSFHITSAQWSRFVATIMPTLAELLTAGLLNAIVDDVELVGGNRKDDLSCRSGDFRFTVEVKTAWWQENTPGSMGCHRRER